MSPVPVTEEIISGDKIPCTVRYKLPNEVATIDNIKFGSANDDSGTLVNVVVTHPKAMSDVEKSLDFEIVFPEMFILAKNPDAEQAGNYTLSGDNVISVKNLLPEGDETNISFYIKEMVGVGNFIDNGLINIDKEITYSINYKVNGSVKPSSTLKREDFNFDVNIDVPLSFHDVKGSTNDIKVAFEKIDLPLESKFDNLEYIQTVESVEFDKNNSWLNFNVSMQTDWLEGFDIKSGYALKVELPSGVVIDNDLSTYKGKGNGVEYNVDDHAFYITDLKTLDKAQWQLSLEKLNVNKPVDNGVCDLDLHAYISFVNENREPVDSLVLAAAEFESLASTLNGLEGERTAEFNMLATDLTIIDAVVKTDVIKATLQETHTDFSFNEEIPSDIGRIDGIGFKKNVAMKFDINIDGLENLNTDIDFDIKLQLPSFLKIEKSPACSQDVNVTIGDGELSVKACYHPMLDEQLTIELLCTGLDFINEEYDFKGLIPTDAPDGKTYLSCPADVIVTGTASIKGTEFHSAAIGKKIDFYINMNVDEIDVKYFHGLFRGDLGNVDTSFDLDLGEELAFLREEGNSITLSEPQIEFVLNNTVAVPVDIDLHIFGNNENGEMIQTSEIEKRVSIHAADYNEETGEITPRETRLFITNDTSKVSKEGYENVEIPNLAHLLEKIPYSINVKANPIVNSEKAHHIDFEQPILLDGTYSVHIPLKFDNLTMSYSNVIELGTSIDETLEMFSNVGLKAKMDIINTIPLGLTLELTPLDNDGKEIEDIEITPLVIKAGDGGAIVDADGKLTEQAAQKFEFAIKSKSGDVSALSKLAFSIKAEANSTVGGAALKSDQGIKISDIVLEVSGDIEVDLKTVYKQEL